MVKLPISDLLAYVVIILQCVILCCSVVNSNSIACGGKSSVIQPVWLGSNRFHIHTHEYSVSVPCPT
jgi:hypothetical protein